MRFVWLLLVVGGCSATAAEWTKTWNVTGQPELRIEAANASIELAGGNQNSISAKVATEGYEIGYSGVQVIENQRGNRVEIRLKEPESMFHIGRHSIRLMVTAPAELTGVFRTGDGSIHIRNVRGNLRVDTGDGSLEGSGLGGSLQAHTGDGSMHFDGTFDSLQLHTGDGSIHVAALPGSRMSSEWELQSGDGSITLRVPRNLAADLFLRTGDGSIDSELPLTVGDLRSKRQIRGKLNGGGPVLSIHTGDGSIHLGAS